MDNKKSSSMRQKPSHPSIISSVLFWLFNLLLLSLLSWFFLEAWFCMKVIFSRDCSTIQLIVNYNMTIIKNQTPSVLINQFNNILSLINAYPGAHIIEIMLAVTEITLTRLFIFIEWAPFILAVMYVLVVDGLVLRDIRKFQGARESTFLFHRLKPLARLSFFTLFFVYMVIPFDIPSTVFVVPMVMLSGIFTTFTIKRFKKYL
jgi:hypothetical protein